MLRTSLTNRLSNSIVAVAALLWIGYARHGWVLYDEFRELWGALSVVVGHQIQWAGGGAAGLDHASPLTSLLYALAIRIHPHEYAALALECYLFCAGFLAFWVTVRSTAVRLWLIVAATSAYRLIDIRSGMDQVGMLGLAFGLAAILQYRRWRISPRWIPIFGLALGLLPHLHASGLFVALALGMGFVAAQQRIRFRSTAYLVGFALLPMLYWLVDTSAVDQNRGWPYVHIFELPSNMGHAILGSFRADATWLADLGLPQPWTGYVYRAMIGGFWVTSMLYVGRRASHLQRGLILLFWLVLLARSDYMLVTQHLVAIAIACLLVIRPIHAPPWMTRWALACVIVQIPLTFHTQLEAQKKGFYRIPYQYFLLATPELQTGEGSMIELPTATYRDQRIHEHSVERNLPLLDPNTRLTVSDILAFAPTGFLHMTDLADSTTRRMLEDLSLPNPALNGPLRATVSWSKMQLAELSSVRLYGTNHLSRVPEPGSWACVPSEFLLRSYCPACVEAWLQIPLSQRRSGLISSCTSASIATGAAFPGVIYVPQ